MAESDGQKPKPLIGSAEIPPALRSLWDSSHEPWGARDRESRFIYANKACLDMLNVEPGKSIEGLFGYELKHPTAKFDDVFRKQDRKAEETRQCISSLDTHVYGRGKLAQPQPYLSQKFPFDNEHGECIGTIFHARKLEVFSIMDYLDGELPSSLTFNPPELESEFSEREHDVIFFLLQSLTSSQIARKMNLSYHTVEGYKESIYSKMHVHRLSQFKECCREKGLHRYVPPKFFYSNSKII